jgi:LysM repeat protein
MKLKKSICIFLLFITVSAFAQNSDNVPRPVVIDYIDTYKAIAISEMKRTGVPASITLAQGIHETEAGTSELVRKSNNHFGIKCKDVWTGDKVYHDDDAKGECFRSYPRAFDSYMDHSDFLKNSVRYAALFRLDPTDYEGWANGLRKAGYATNPKYASILIKIINNYHLQDYTLIALGKLKPEEEWLASVKTDNSPLNIDFVIADANVKPEEPAMTYPDGEFRINDTRVVYAKSGTSLLSIAEKYNVGFRRLIDFNDLGKNEEDNLSNGQLIYLQRKRKTGANEFHTVANGESLYDIAQAEGIRLESLLDLNHLANGMQPAVGERLYMKSSSPARPVLLAARSGTIAGMLPVAPATQEPKDAYTMHVVQTKETLYAISKRYNVPVEKLKAWNNLVTYDLKTGQELIIYKN